MNKKLNSLLISLIIVFFLCNFIVNSEILFNTFFDSINLWFTKLFPTMFVFFILSDLLNNYHFPLIMKKIFGKTYAKLFKLPKESSYISFLSMTSGFPSNAKIILDAIDNQIINEMDANKLLTMTHFSNPLFIIYTIGINILNNKKIGIIILLSHYLTNFIIGFLFRNIYQNNDNKKMITYKPSLPFITILKKSINNTIKISLNVLGIIIFFSLFVKTINLYLNLNPFSNLLLNGLLEITNGLNILSKVSFNIISKATIATFFISFGGISIHLQVMSILSKRNINYYLYFISRLLHAGISSLITFIILINSY